MSSSWQLSRSIRPWELKHICSKEDSLPPNFFDHSIFGQSIAGHQHSTANKCTSDLRIDNFIKAGFPNDFCKVLEFGLPILLHTIPPRRVVKNHDTATAVENQDFVTKTLLKWEKMGVIRYTENAPYLVNPFSVVVSGEKKRLVLDARASGLNDHILAPKFMLPSIETVVASLQDGDYLMKMDLASGFLQLPINDREQTYLGFQNPVDGRFGIVQRLPFGLRSAPFLFASFTYALKVAAKQILNLATEVYIDDWLLKNHSRANLLQDFTEFSELLGHLGVAIQHEKTEGPGQCITYLGLQVNTQEHKIILPEAKRLRYLQGICEILERENHTMALLAKTAGRLVHIATVHKAGAANIQPLWEILYADRKQWTKAQLLKEKLTMNDELKESLQWWKDVLSEANIHRKIWCDVDRKLFLWSSDTATLMPGVAKTICTDASDHGWGASTGITTSAGTWTEKQKLTSINWRELKTINLAICCWNFLSNSPILVLTDSSTAVAAVRKRASKAEALQVLIRELARLEKKRNIEVVAVHLPGELNDLPDKLSRGLPFDTASLLSFNPTTLPEELRTITQLRGCMWEKSKFNVCPFVRLRNLNLDPQDAIIAVSTPDLPFIKLQLKQLARHTSKVFLLTPQIPSSEMPLSLTTEIKVEGAIVCNNAPNLKWIILKVQQHGGTAVKTVTYL